MNSQTESDDVVPALVFLALVVGLAAIFYFAHPMRIFRRTRRQIRRLPERIKERV